MIHQFSELGHYYQQREGAGENALAQFANDPGAKFGNRVLLIQFSPTGFGDIAVKDYEEAQRLRYLYRKGPPNKWDATPTSGMPAWDPKKADDFEGKVGTRLMRMGKSIRDVLNGDLSKLPAWEKAALEKMSHVLLEDATRIPIITMLKNRHPNPKDRAFLSVVWTAGDDVQPKHVGDFEAFRHQLLQRAEAERTKTGENKKGFNMGQCSVCGGIEVEVTEPPSIYWPPLYTTDKPGSVSSGFDLMQAWKNFPTCQACYERVDFARERIKKHLSFDYYGFQYLVLPSPVAPQPSEFREFLDRLDKARLNNKSAKKLISAEDDLAFILAEEQNRLQFDFMFFKGDPQSFRPALYVSGMVPSRFRELFAAKERTEAHPWCQSPSPKPFYAAPFTFGELHDVFYPGRKGGAFDDDFLAATRAALERSRVPYFRLLEVGMRWLQEDRLEDKPWIFRVAHLFRSLLFFEELIPSNHNSHHMNVDYGISEQADRVRRLFAQAPGKLSHDPTPQAVFLIGACCSRIELIQQNVRGSAPFASKLKGFRLNERDVRTLFRAAKEKGSSYGDDEERKVAGLLQCAGSALFASPDQWSLSPDEVSYFFALGHALRPRLAKAAEEDATNG
jgi:CRISPR-associated protein Csh1